MNEANVLFFARAIICLSPVFPQFFQREPREAVELGNDHAESEMLN
jgi:hypothetical protein